VLAGNPVGSGGWETGLFPEPCDSVGQTGLVQHNTKKGPWQRSVQLEDPYLRMEMISQSQSPSLDWILPRACKYVED
jgi:hypothetical protein